MLDLDWSLLLLWMSFMWSKVQCAWDNIILCISYALSGRLTNSTKMDSEPNYTTPAHWFVTATLRLGLQAPLVAPNNISNILGKLSMPYLIVCQDFSIKKHSLPHFIVLVLLTAIPLFRKVNFCNTVLVTSLSVMVSTTALLFLKVSSSICVIASVFNFLLLKSRWFSGTVSPHRGLVFGGGQHLKDALGFLFDRTWSCTLFSSLHRLTVGSNLNKVFEWLWGMDKFPNILINNFCLHMLPRSLQTQTCPINNKRFWWK